MATPETQPLFFEAKPLLKKTAGGRKRKLSNNTSEWGRQILDALHNEQQELNDKKIDFVWESKDDQTGNAVGRAIIDRKMSIPLIVNNFRLEPLDTVCDTQARPHRLNPKRLRKGTFKSDLFSGIVSPQDERGLMPDVPLYRSYGVLPWEEGRRVFASEGLMAKIPQADFEKHAQDGRSILSLAYNVATQPDKALSGNDRYSFLDTILEDATSQDLRKFATALNSDPQISVNFYAHGNQEMISKILHTRPESIEKVAEDLADNLPVSVVQLRFGPDHTLTMKVASDGVYAPQEVVLPRERFQATLSNLGISDTEGALKKAASPLGLVITCRPQNSSPIYQDTLKGTESVTKFGHYIVRDVSGHEHRGSVFPQFYTLGKKAFQRSLFLSPGFSALQVKIAAMPDPNPPEELSSSIPQTGDTGCFVLEKGAEAVALEPVTIQYLEKVGEEIRIVANTLMGESVMFHLSKNARDLVALPQKTGAANHYLLPSSWKFAKASNLQAEEVLVSEPALLNKMAHNEIIGKNSVRVSAPVGGRLFLFEGPIAEKMGCNQIEQYPDEALFKLACMGLSVEGAQEALQRAQVAHTVVLGGLRDIQPAQDVLGHEKRATRMQTLASLPCLQQDTSKLIKIAGDVKDPTSVDRILALNFLNPSNIGILVDHMKDLEDTGTRLSEMLMAARLGARSDLNESAIVQARQAIDDVLDGLTQLRSRLGPATGSDESGGSAE